MKKKIQTTLGGIVVFLFLLGMANLTYALPFYEAFNDLDDWTNNSTPLTASQISPAGFLDQDSSGSATDTAWIQQDIGTIGTGDYTVQFNACFISLLEQDWIHINAGTNMLDITVKSDGLYINPDNGASGQDKSVDLNWDPQTYYTFDLIVHDSQTLVDIYIDNALKASDVACARPTGTDGLIYMYMFDHNNHWSFDYLNIVDGRILPGSGDNDTHPIPEPGTMILLGSLATGLFGLSGIKNRKG